MFTKKGEKLYEVIDLETTSNETYGRFANQFDPKNRIVAVAEKIEGHSSFATMNVEAFLKTWTLDGIDVLVGHNIKFDLLYLWSNPHLQKFIKTGGRIWDTMHAEYLLSGQEHKYAALDDLSVKYGGTLKDTYVKEVFDSGKGAEDIEPETLLDYARGDVDNTELVMLSQLKKAKELGMMPIMRVHMDHLLVLCEMEYNGLVVDRDRLLEHRENTKTQLKEIESSIQRCVRNIWSAPMTFNPCSSQHISILLFGGPVTYERSEIKVDEFGNPIVNKGGNNPGKVKTKKVKVTDILLPKCVVDYKERTKASKEGIFKVDEDVIKDLYQRNRTNPIGEFLELLLQHRKVTRILSTYVGEGTVKRPSGLGSFIHPDGRIHPSLESVGTVTGRTSSNQPNMQNVPHDLRDIFVSRWGDDGEIVAVDYSQIEIAVEAYLIQSDKMIKEIEEGVDFHSKRLAWAEGREYDEVVRLVKDDPAWKQKRTQIKAVSFAKQYGAGPDKVAKDTGLPLSIVQKIYDDEASEYPESKMLLDASRVEAKRTTTARDGPLYVKDFKKGITVIYEDEQTHVGYNTSILNKRYHFKEYACFDDRGAIRRYYKSTQLANYKTQGTAGDIFFMMLGKLYRILLDKYPKDAIMILEVHDECVLDVKKSISKEVKLLIKEVLESVPEELEKRFKLKFNVPLKAAVSSGVHWAEAK